MLAVGYSNVHILHNQRWVMGGGGVWLGLKLVEIIIEEEVDFSNIVAF